MKDKLPVILFISTNDGSDMRINKEIRSLQKKAEVIFLGVGDGSKCYVSEYCKKVILVKGKRTSLYVLSKQILTFIWLLITKKVKTVHIINEEFYLLLYPFLVFKHTVLDLFDSVFLRKNLSGERLKGIKRIVYWAANTILVTDENRYNLMPECIKQKCLILPNYPETTNFTNEKESSDDLRILYYGWMGLNRGTEIIEGLLKTNFPLKIYMAGWFSDEYTSRMVKEYEARVEFVNVLPQRKALELARTKADYILCVYAPINENNINASPNKVYDAIQTQTPLIMNAEVKVSEWVLDKGIGFIFPEYKVEDYNELYNCLQSAKNTFVFSEDLRIDFNWENVADSLLKAHQLS